jgi:hypothetical protein
MECPLCKAKMEAEVVLTGGCGGHFGEDDRCYCDSADVHIEFRCSNSKPGNYVEKGKKMKLTWVKNPNPCKQKPLQVSELSDQYSLGRWFTENYTPSPDALVIPVPRKWYEHD